MAVPTPMTTATRSPDKIAGTASGHSTCHSTCRRVMPIATAHSTTALVDPLDAGDGAAQDRQHRIQRQRDERGAGADAADERQRDEEAEERQAGNGLREIGESDDRSGQPGAMRGHQAKGNRDRGGQCARPHHEQHVLAEPGEELGAVLDEERARAR